MTSYLSEMPIETLISQCKQERGLRDVNRPSPACIELFRLAFGGNQRAWQAVNDIFAPMVYSWIRKGINAAEWQEEEIDDLAQDIFLKFSHVVPQVTGLRETDQLSRILAYLKTTSKRRVLKEFRTRKGKPITVPLEEQLEPAEPAKEYQWVELRETLGPIFERLLKTEDERLIAFLRIECGITRREIAQMHPERFAEKEIDVILQRVKRRMQSDPQMQQVAETLRQKSLHFASLSIEESFGEAARTEQGSSMYDLCPVDELDLLDYISGLATAAIRQAIEASPACRQAAAELHHSISPLLAILYRRTCPSVVVLVEYQERRLGGMEQLIIHRHVETCPLCREEVAAMDRMDFQPAPGSGFLRRLVEAIYQPPSALGQPVRGEVLHFHAPSIHVNISLHHTPETQRVWSIRGQVRSPAGNLMGDSVEGVWLASQSEDESVKYAVDWSEGRRSFVFPSVPAGLYQLHLQLVDEEVIIRKLQIGDVV